MNQANIVAFHRDAAPCLVAHVGLVLMAPKSKSKKKEKKETDAGSGLLKAAGEPGDPVELTLLVPILEDRLARMQVKLEVARAGHTDASGRLDQQQVDQNEVFEHLERELAKKTDEIAALEARVLLLQEENAMQSMLADRRLASQQEAHETEIARLKCEHDIVEADLAPSFSAPAATGGELVTPQLNSQPDATRSADSYDAKHLLRMIVSSRPNVYHQVRIWLLDEGGTKGRL